MSEFKGTKGKWEMLREPWYDESNETYSGSFDIMSEDTKVVEVHAYNFWGLTFDESKANALLISKAPEMLEMLKRLTTLIAEIDSTLFHHNHSVNGWHLNGDDEPMMNFVAEMDMEALSEAEELIKQATEI